jgi:hypothetical protein
MKTFFIILIVLCFPVLISAQTSTWPRTLTLKNGGKIIMYQPQPENLRGDKLSGRAAISVRQTASDEPVFGAIWMEANIQTNRDTRMATLESIKITDVRLPGIDDSVKLGKLKTFLETEIPKWDLDMSMDEIIASIESEQ